MTIEERLDNLDGLRLWRDTQRKLSELTERVLKQDENIARMGDEFREADRRLGERIREVNESLGQRITELTTAIGALIARMSVPPHQP